MLLLLLLLLLVLVLVLVIVLVVVLLLDELVGDTEEFRRVGAEDEAALGLGESGGCAHQVADELLTKWEGVVGAEHDTMRAEGVDEQAERACVEDGRVDREPIQIV